MTHIHISKDSSQNLVDTAKSTAIPVENINKLNSQVQQTLDLLPQLIWMTQDGVGYANSALKNYFGNIQNTFEDIQLINAFHPEDSEHFLNLWNNSKKNGSEFELECRIKDVEDNYQWFQLIAKSTKKYNNSYDWIFSCTNINSRSVLLRETTEALKTNTAMLDASVDCIKVITPEGLVSHMNRSGTAALLGSDYQGSFGMEWISLLPPEVREHGRKAIKESANGKNARFAGKSDAGGVNMYWDNILTPVLNEDNQTTRILCVSRDITLQRIAEEKLRISSEYDDLTSLMNRRAFRARIRKTLKKVKSKGTIFAVMIIDLDHFKHVNDTLGHIAGDYLLKALSKRLNKVLPENAYIARLGGDEFAVVVENFDSNSNDLANIAKKLLKQAYSPIKYQGKIINVGMSIGSSIFPFDAQDVPTLLKNADTALNDLKDQGRGGFRIFNPEMLQQVQLKAEQLSTARQIIRENTIEPYYQAKVDLNTFELTGFEALLRWKDANNEINLPFTVEEAFNDYDLASKISDIIQTKVFKDLSSWIEQEMNVVPISINASPVEFMRDDYAELLLKRLKKFKVPHHLIEIEITEHILAERGAEYVIRALTQLKDAGVRIALDDFGTGHSSMTHLRDYPVDCLKIDYNFVNRINEEKSINAIVEGIAKLGPILSLDVIAEGIETREQLESLKNFGCKYGQGFLFSKAICADQAVQIIKQGGFSNVD